MKKGRDFLDIDCVQADELRGILALAHRLKRSPLAYQPMKDKTLALVFEKPSTRTRVSFEVGMRQLGGHVTALSGAELQLGRGETVADTGRVLSRYADLVMIRTFEENKLHELAEGSSIPIINGLTNQSHPCQVMADLMTVEERFGSLGGKTVVWAGDGDNNVLNSWIHAAVVYQFSLRVLCPSEFPPQPAILLTAQQQGARIDVSADINAADGADVVMTDGWVSMHNSDVSVRYKLMLPYQVDAAFMARAKPNALFLHCLPAKRNQEVTDEVMDGPQSAVWDEAENRLHVQKAIMCWCLGVEKGV